LIDAVDFHEDDRRAGEEVRSAEQTAEIRFSLSEPEQGSDRGDGESAGRTDGYFAGADLLDPAT
jgi:hypothetical protein